MSTTTCGERDGVRGQGAAKQARGRLQVASAEKAHVRHENLGRLLMDSFRFFRQCTLVNLRSHGFTDLNPVHAAMLRRVDEGGTTIGDIAQRMGITKQAAAQLVSRTATLGYVAVRTNATDSRKKMVRCTVRGKRFLKSLESVVEDSVHDVAELIGTQRLHELEDILKVIAARGRLRDSNGKRRLPEEEGIAVAISPQGRKKVRSGAARSASPSRKY